MDRYELIKIIGEGTYGHILQCKHRRTGRIVAVKRFKQTDSNEYVRYTMLRELRIQQLLKGEPCVVQLLEAFKEKGRLYLVMEHIPGSLLDVLDANPNGLVLSDVRTLLYTLLLGVHSCHANQIIHRDIKPENVLVRTDKSAVLCDFGFSRPAMPDAVRARKALQGAAQEPTDGRDSCGSRQDNPNSHHRRASLLEQLILPNHGNTMTDYVATRWYRSPEMLLGMSHYSFAVDIWAVGAIMAEVVDGQPLLPGKTELEQLSLIQTRIGDFPPEYESLVRKRNGGVLRLRSGAARARNPLAGMAPDEESHPYLRYGIAGSSRRLRTTAYLRTRFEAALGPDGFDLLVRLLAVDAKDRLTAEAALTHPFFSKHNGEAHRDEAIAFPSSPFILHPDSTCASVSANSRSSVRRTTTCSRHDGEHLTPQAIAPATNTSPEEAEPTVPLLLPPPSPPLSAAQVSQSKEVKAVEEEQLQPALLPTSANLSAPVGPLSSAQETKSVAEAPHAAQPKSSAPQDRLPTTTPPLSVSARREPARHSPNVRRASLPDGTPSLPHLKSEMELLPSPSAVRRRHKTNARSCVASPSRREGTSLACSRQDNRHTSRRRLGEDSVTPATRRSSNESDSTKSEINLAGAVGPQHDGSSNSFSMDKPTLLQEIESLSCAIAPPSLLEVMLPASSSADHLMGGSRGVKRVRQLPPSGSGGGKPSKASITGDGSPPHSPLKRLVFASSRQSSRSTRGSRSHPESLVKSTASHDEAAHSGGNFSTSSPKKTPPPLPLSVRRTRRAEPTEGSQAHLPHLFFRSKQSSDVLSSTSAVDAVHSPNAVRASLTIPARPAESTLKLQPVLQRQASSYNDHKPGVSALHRGPVAPPMPQTLSPQAPLESTHKPTTHASQAASARDARTPEMLSLPRRPAGDRPQSENGRAAMQRRLSNMSAGATPCTDGKETRSPVAALVVQREGKLERQLPPLEIDPSYSVSSASSVSGAGSVMPDARSSAASYLLEDNGGAEEGHWLKKQTATAFPICNFLIPPAPDVAEGSKHVPSTIKNTGAGAAPLEDKSGASFSSTLLGVSLDSVRRFQQQRGNKGRKGRLVLRD